MCPRTFSVRQIGTLLQLDDLMDEAKQVVVLFSLRNGGPQVIFHSEDKLRVPEFSFLDFVVVQKERQCEAAESTPHSQRDDVLNGPDEDNTATSGLGEQELEQDSAGITTLMQRFAVSSGRLFSRDLLQHQVWSSELSSHDGGAVHWAAFQEFV